MSEQKFREAKSQLAHSQALVDKLRLAQSPQPQNAAQVIDQPTAGVNPSSKMSQNNNEMPQEEAKEAAKEQSDNQKQEVEIQDLQQQIQIINAKLGIDTGPQNPQQ